MYRNVYDYSYNLHFKVHFNHLTYFGGHVEFFEELFINLEWGSIKHYEKIIIANFRISVSKLKVLAIKTNSCIYCELV